MKKILPLVILISIFNANLWAALENQERRLPSSNLNLSNSTLKRIMVPKTISENALRTYISSIVLYDKNMGRGKSDEIGHREQISMLVDLGPGNLDLIISECTHLMQVHAPAYVGRIVQAVSGELATDQHKNIILKSFKENAYLAEVVDKFGWVDEASSSFVVHLRKYPLAKSGYSGAETAFFRACFKSNSPDVANAISYVISDPEFQILDGVCLNFHGEMNPLMASRIWSAAIKAKKTSVEIACRAVYVGEIGALELLAKFVNASDSNSLNTKSYANSRVLKFCAILSKLTNAPEGSPKEVSAWVLGRLKSLKWDDSVKKFL